MRLYREARLGELATGDATRLAHIVGLVGKMLESAQLAELEQRIVALEAVRAARP